MNSKLGYININLFKKLRMKIRLRCKGVRKFKSKLGAEIVVHLDSKKNSEML